MTAMKKRGRKPKCIFCDSGHTISKGVRKTTTLGNRALRVCKDCGRKFTVGRIVHGNPDESAAEVGS